MAHRSMGWLAIFLAVVLVTPASADRSQRIGWEQDCNEARGMKTRVLGELTALRRLRPPRRRLLERDVLRAHLRVSQGLIRLYCHGR